jgi:hypothetical protein
MGKTSNEKICGQIILYGQRGSGISAEARNASPEDSI